jgi:hypothetical protein
MAGIEPVTGNTHKVKYIVSPAVTVTTIPGVRSKTVVVVAQGKIVVWWIIK